MPNSGAYSPTSPRVSTHINKNHKNRAGVEKPTVSLHLELDERLGTRSYAGDPYQVDVAPLRLDNGTITSQQQFSDRSATSGATSTVSDPVSASSEPAKTPRASRGTTSRSPRAPDERKSRSFADRGSRSSRSVRLSADKQRASRNTGPLLSPRHHNELQRASPRGGKLPSLQLKVMSPRHQAWRQQQQLSASLSPRCTTADAATKFGFSRPDEVGRSTSPLRRRGTTSLGQGDSGGRGSLRHSMLARETGRLQLNRKRFGLEIET